MVIPSSPALPRRAAFRDFGVDHAFENSGREVMLLSARRLGRGAGDGEDGLSKPPADLPAVAGGASRWTTPATS